MDHALRVRLGRTAALLAAVGSLGALQATVASAGPAMPHHHEVSALFVVDHRGTRPTRKDDLVAYSQAFHAILRSCRINAENLTNTMLWLADKASDQGQRRVSSLMMMQSVARRITWTRQAPCWGIFDLAEGHLEAGDP